MRSQGDESHRALVTDAALLLMVQNKALLTHTDLTQVGPCGGYVCGLLLCFCGPFWGSGRREGQTGTRVSPPPTLVPGDLLGELAPITVELHTH